MTDTSTLVEIQQVHALYGHILDEGLWDRLIDVFTDDAVFDATASGVPLMNGLGEIREKLIPLEEAVVPRVHVATNLVVLEDGAPEMSVLSKFIAYSTFQGPPQLVFGSYRDGMQKTDRGWRIAHRLVTRHAVEWFSPQKNGSLGKGEAQ